MLRPKSHLRNGEGGTAGLKEQHISQQAQQEAIQHHKLQEKRRRTVQALAS